jgi:hydroxyacyl-ACP dehydratase HTD2-like protein with hotdog domain
MVDKSAVGATDEPFEMIVEKGKIREFAVATKSKNPEYLAADEPVSPATFLAASAFWSPPGAGAVGRAQLDLRRVLHGGSEFVFNGPPPKAGAKLTAQGRIADIYEKEGKRGGTMTFVETVQEFRDEDGNVVAESRATVIETGQAPKEAE